jgi:hypothetical protein
LRGRLEGWMRAQIRSILRDARKSALLRMRLTSRDFSAAAEFG